MQVDINVTQEMIDTCTGTTPWDCPVATAINHGPNVISDQAPSGARVSHYRITIFKDVSQLNVSDVNVQRDTVTFDNHPEVRDWIHDYDLGKPRDPITIRFDTQNKTATRKEP